MIWIFFEQIDFGDLFQTRSSHDVDVKLWNLGLWYWTFLYLYAVHLQKHKASLFPAMLFNLGSLEKHTVKNRFLHPGIKYFPIDFPQCKKKNQPCCFKGNMHLQCIFKSKYKKLSEMNTSALRTSEAATRYPLSPRSASVPSSKNTDTRRSMTISEQDKQN